MCNENRDRTRSSAPYAGYLAIFPCVLRGGEFRVSGRGVADCHPRGVGTEPLLSRLRSPGTARHGCTFSRSSNFLQRFSWRGLRTAASCYQKRYFSFSMPRQPRGSVVAPIPWCPGLLLAPTRPFSPRFQLLACGSIAQMSPQICWPPLTSRVAPVVQLDAGETRNTAAAATSSTVPNRGMGSLLISIPMPP